MPSRTPEQIRSSIESNRNELAVSIANLRGEVVQFTDWRGHIRRREREVLAGAAAVGFFIGGGIAGFGGLLRRRKR
jgi:hypothetical protein